MSAPFQPLPPVDTTPADTTNEPAVTRPESVLVPLTAVAEMCGGCSKRHVMRLADSGRMPRPIKLGHLLRWRRDDITRWIADGCPRCE